MDLTARKMVRYGEIQAHLDRQGMIPEAREARRFAAWLAAACGVGAAVPAGDTFTG